MLDGRVLAGHLIHNTKEVRRGKGSFLVFRSSIQPRQTRAVRHCTGIVGTRHSRGHDGRILRMLLCTDRTSLNISRTVGSGVIDVDADVDDDDDDDDGGGYLSTTRSGVLRD